MAAAAAVGEQKTSFGRVERDAEMNAAAAVPLETLAAAAAAGGVSHSLAHSLAPFTRMRLV